MTERDGLATPRRLRRADATALGAYLAVAVMVAGGLWRNPHGRVLVDNHEDLFYEWVLANGARTVVELRHPLFTTFLNAPDGINLMANTSMWAVTLPLAPITLLLGAPVSYAVLTTLDMAGTAAAWYYLMSRELVASRLAGFVGGAVCGFCPAMVSQLTGHPNIAAQFALPFFVLVVLRLRHPGDGRRSDLRRGLVLAGLVVYQFFLNEELLLFTALALGVYVLAYAGIRPAVVREALPRTLRTFAVTTVVAGAVLAYPLWFQFAGPQSYSGLQPEIVNNYGTDVASYAAYARESLAGHAGAARRLAEPQEQNAYFGWSLLALLAFVAVRLRRDPRVRPLITVGLTFAICSLGTQIEINGHHTGIHAPWLAVQRIPLLDSVIPTRFALVVWPVAAMLLAFLVDHLTPPEGGWPTQRLIGAVAVVTALLPIAPTPLTTRAAEPMPRYFTSGDWRDTVHDGDTVLSLPFGIHSTLDAMRWQTYAGVRYRMVSGLFLAPEDTPQRRGALGPQVSHLWRVFDETLDWSAPRQLTDADAGAVRADLRRWRVDAVLLPDRHPDAAALRTTAEAILGPGAHVADMWVWRAPAS